MDVVMSEKLALDQPARRARNVGEQSRENAKSFDTRKEVRLGWMKSLPHR
jgi:hypothetical protein